MVDVLAMLQGVMAQMANEADDERAAAALRFFPNKPPVLGLPSGYANELGRQLARELKEAAPESVIQVAEELYSTGIMEHGALANEMLGKSWKRFRLEHWDVFEHWIGLFTCWGTTDSFCLKFLGRLVVRDGVDLHRLQGWSRQEDVWYRRASLVCLARGLRTGAFARELFHLADRVLDDPEPMVQKGIGWMLKELSKGDAEATIGYLSQRSHRMTPLAFRYAQEKLTPEQRDRVVSL